MALDASMIGRDWCMVFHASESSRLMPVRSTLVVNDAPKYVVPESINPIVGELVPISARLSVATVVGSIPKVPQVTPLSVRSPHFQRPSAASWDSKRTLLQVLFP